jgi:integrase
MNEQLKDSAHPVRYFSKKYGSYYSLRYYSPLTGKLTHVPLKRSGKFNSAKEAMDWAHRHLRTILGEELKALERQNWRNHSTIVRHFNEYSIHKHEEQPRSASQDLSMLTNYGIPFFVTVLKELDPNKWGEFNEELLHWLRRDARTIKGEKLAVSSCNKVINSLNQFLKWMRRKKIIDYNSFRQLEGVDQRLQNRRGSKDLITPEVFERVYLFLSKRNQLYADLWFTQRHMGFRINEVLGLAFNWLSDECPVFIKSEFESHQITVYGSIYLESQPAKPYIKRVKGVIKRAPLKWRREISVDNARTVPILNAALWNMLVNRYQYQCGLWEGQVHGPIKESYLLFDGAQRHKYHEAVREACQSMQLESCGTHALRHTLSTEWTALKISDKVAEIVLGHKAEAHKVYVHIVGQVNSERLKAQPLKVLTKIVEK